MSINMNDGKNIPNDTEAYYEELASQEELYLEEIEEEVRAILVSYDSSASQNNSLMFGENCQVLELDWELEGSMTNANDDPRMAKNLDEQLNRAAEELITGDSDDPPLSEEAVEETLRTTSNVAGSSQDQSDL